MAAEWGDPEGFNRYKRASIEVSRLHDQLAQLAQRAETPSLRTAINANHVAAEIADIELEAAFVAYCSPRN